MNKTKNKGDHALKRTNDAVEPLTALASPGDQGRQGTRVGRGPVWDLGIAGVSPLCVVLNLLMTQAAPGG